MKVVDLPPIIGPDRSWRVWGGRRCIAASKYCRRLAGSCLSATIQGSGGQAWPPPFTQPFSDYAMIPERKPTTTRRTVRRDPVFVDGVRPRPMFVDYKDLDLLSKLTNRHGRIVSRRKTGCHASS